MINLDFSILVTILYLLILYFFMNRLFFRPISDVLAKRRQLIEGRLEEAQHRMEQAERKAAEYENAVKAARTEAYRRQEIEREKALSEKAAIVAQAKAEADQVIQEGRKQVHADAAAVRKKLEAEVDMLAGRLTASMLRD